MEVNYRSKDHIVQAGNAIIARNEKQYQKNVTSNRGGSDHIRVFGFTDEFDEATQIIDLMKRLQKEKGFKWSDFAVLYRTNSQSQPFEQILLQEGIPYKIWGGLKFFERKEIKDIISYIKYIMNKKDNISLKRIINTPNRKI
nr:3'-5' exonuclease [Candidatus Vampirococcus lugosii]